ncbi:cation transport protein ChaC [Rhizobium sp. BK529]|uniref:gamma-glutamylcyclotransferase n=1 Tax=unclassified Rhizobium TaxID=2613769 RepID=UPI00104E5C96|nr:MULTISPECIES: gamma-glutamylcyclotransferase [unclassified Rhizobium]MBB3590446.1 cation transport protein ChaC [Rhizobium sp. BK529]TCS05136.1 cation transport protein ChaC [Rhizobium sp. BK418]
MTVNTKTCDAIACCGEEILSRELLLSGTFAGLLATEAPTLRLLSDEERQASLASILAERPAGDVWIFAYGSLIWNPIILSVESRKARIEGWSRSFCLTTVSGRGSPDNPGLVLGLDAGGSCDGVALRLEEEGLLHELELLWRREMVAEAYIPRWVDLLDQEGAPFGRGITFTMNPLANTYAGGLSREVIIQRLATASGSIGSSADYLFRTREGLRALDMWDERLEELATEVEEAQRKLQRLTGEGA